VSCEKEAAALFWGEEAGGARIAFDEGPHLYEVESPILFGNDVKLAVAAADIAGDDSVAGGPEVACNGLFGFSRPTRVVAIPW
jgi:hypothetical protein